MRRIAGRRSCRVDEPSCSRLTKLSLDSTMRPLKRWSSAPAKERLWCEADTLGGTSGAGGTATCFTSMRVSCLDRKSTRLNSSHLVISYAVFCLKKKKKQHTR